MRCIVNKARETPTKNIYSNIAFTYSIIYSHNQWRHIVTYLVKKKEKAMKIKCSGHVDLGLECLMEIIINLFLWVIGTIMVVL